MVGAGLAFARAAPDASTRRVAAAPRRPRFSRLPHHMSLSDASLVHAAAWLLAQLPDTIVTRQVPIQGTWFDQFQAVLRTLMTLAILVLTVAVVPAAWNFRKSYSKIS